MGFRTRRSDHYNHFIYLQFKTDSYHLKVHPDQVHDFGLIGSVTIRKTMRNVSHAATRYVTSDVLSSPEHLWFGPFFVV